MSDESKPQRMSYEETLAYTQSLRKDVVDNLVSPEDGSPPVGDKEKLDFMLRTLKDMDSTALNDRKNTIDRDNADSSKTVAEAMQQFLVMQGNSNPFERRTDGSAPAVIPDADPEKLGEQSLVEGEGETGVIEETSASFMERMESGGE